MVSFIKTHLSENNNQNNAVREKLQRNIYNRNINDAHYSLRITILVPLPASRKVY